MLDRPHPSEASRLNGYSCNPLVRQSEARDEECIVRALADATTRLYLFAGEKAAFTGEQGALNPLFALENARQLGVDLSKTVLLGRLDGVARLAAPIPADAGEQAALTLIDLRTIAVEGLVTADHLGPLAQAKSLLDWHARHGFCARCGAPTMMACGGYRRDCPACETQHFPRTDPVAIMLAIDGERALLARQARFLPGMFSALAGFIEPGETIEDAVRREVKEEAGISVGRVRYFSSQPWPFPSSLMIGCHVEALDRALALDLNELEDGRWFAREEVTLMLERRHPGGLITPPPMAIAHQLIRAFIDRGEALLEDQGTG